MGRIRLQANHYECSYIVRYHIIPLLAVFCIVLYEKKWRCVSSYENLEKCRYLFYDVKSFGAARLCGCTKLLRRQSEEAKPIAAQLPVFAIPLRGTRSLRCLLIRVACQMSEHLCKQACSVAQPLDRAFIINGQVTYMITENPVGVLDSGVGGISILKALVEFMPYENFMYFGDSANAPYGEKTREQIRKLTMDSVAVLLERGCKAIVVACNTATAAAIDQLRETYPDIPMIGLEPALKPAVLHKEHSRVIVMATPFTLKEQKFETLKNRYQSQAEIIPMACPEIVRFVERQELYSPELLIYLRRKFEPYMGQKIDAVVLGCTHFPFVRKAIQEVAGRDVILYDSALGVGRQVRHQMESHGLLNTSGKRGQVTILNSKGEEGVLLCEKLLHS